METHTATVGKTIIGANHPVAVQSMYDRPVGKDIDSVIEKLCTLKAMGCDIFRFTYCDRNDAAALKQICLRSPMPLVADIHFDYNMALEALDLGFDAVRINPGNIGAKYKTLEVVKKARDLGRCIRIGLNSGSLPKNEKGLSQHEIMTRTALEYIDWFESEGFFNTVVSLKSSDPEETYLAAKAFAENSGYPQHLGVTEAGSVISSVVRGTWTLGRLLENGIGATIRYSINGPIESEVQAGVELLRTLGLRQGGVRIIACPRCGRYSFDSEGFLAQVEPQLLTSGKSACVAFMGCQVNGPGEARNADLAVTGIGNAIFLYRKGELYRKVDKENALEAFWEAFGQL
ncbi:MAG: (E)-4-hydroxy-3-methylbut-2-enyl-diphosphate synthase [Sphaerochaetaceae bacterium]|jgi:(E)-4-hydroxy-3-methylbut-2-enyl-diphosphate synthase|nr:(E)-4-hydroxy-3-methylbut-2-enyl-diphosphate synthase [Sphaerochaetaceae bacterium]